MSPTHPGALPSLLTCIPAGQVSVTSGGEMVRSASHLDMIRAGAAVQGRVDAFESPGGIHLHAVLNTLLPLAG